ncbi:hypothetical protein [Agrobacterium vitis]|uniref:hypothetical protein n=1 Tax=Agrobacterium vitis TaxID=373 RepID=UPI0012E80214|nr:hypothetical protein [Agrobacterium vitis]MVA33702.1 hypothetical protein [Agrobacterium vitis]
MIVLAGKTFGVEIVSMLEEFWRKNFLVCLHGQRKSIHICWRVLELLQRMSNNRLVLSTLAKLKSSIRILPMGTEDDGLLALLLIAASKSVAR